MLIYVFIFLLFLYLSVYCDNGRSSVEVRNRWWRISFIILFLLAGLRNGVGGDIVHYSARFREWPNILELFAYEMDWSEILQPLWFFINCVLKTIWNDFTILQLFHAFVFNALLFRFIRKTTNKPFTVLLFVYCMVWWNLSFEVMRESLCVVIYLNALLYLKDGSVGKYLLSALPCLFIHYFAFVALFVTLLVYYVKNNLLVLITILMSIVISVVDTSSIMNYIMGIMEYMGDELIERTEYYIESKSWGEINLNMVGILVQIIYLLYPTILAWNIKDDPNRKLEVKLICLFVLFYVFSSQLIIFHRFLNYFWIFIIIETINYLYNHKTHKTLQFYIVVVLFIYTAIGDVKEFYQPSQFDKDSGLSYDYRYIPYTSIFQEPDPIRESYYLYY